MKILLIGDASNYHNALSVGLSRLGHEVTVASNGSRWMDTARHIDLRRSGGKFGGALLWVRLNTLLASRLKGYDVVQLVNPIFLELKPKRVASLFRKLKRDNGGVFLTALGTDTAYLRMAMGKNSPLGYSEWQIGGYAAPLAESARGEQLKSWLRDPLLSHAEMVYENVDGVVSALYEYHLSMKGVVPDDKLTYGGIPIDVESIEFDSRGFDSTPLKVLAPYHSGREFEKGIDVLMDIAEKIPGIDLQPVTGLKFADFVKRLRESDVVLDQYYSYTPATTALMAMAMGKIVVTGAEPEFEDFIGGQVPAFNASPFNNDEIREFLVAAREGKKSGRESEIEFKGKIIGGSSAREFVKHQNDTEVVAARFIDFWQGKL